MYRRSIICLIIVALLAAGCAVLRLSPTSTPTAAPTNTPTPTATAPQAVQSLATPYAVQPAAGICAGPAEGETAAIEINPDAPSPRCLKATADQKLLVTNRTAAPIVITLGSYPVSLEPGASQLLEVRLGDVFAPGVHVLQVEPYFGPEIWLVAP